MDADLFANDSPAAPPPRWQRWRDALRPARWLGTLKLRLAVGALLALLAGMGWVAWQMGQVAERELIAQAQWREQQEAQRIAAVVGQRLAELQRALASLAGATDPATVENPQLLQAFLGRQAMLLAMFHMVNVSDAEGRVLVSIDESGVQQPRVSIADREHFRRAIGERRAQISGPLHGRVAGEPVVALVHPVLAGERVVAVVGGLLRLSRHELLADLAGVSGGTGGVVVVTDAAGRIVAHPQPALLMRPLADEPRLAAAYAQWLQQGRPLQRAAGSWRQPGHVVAMAGDARSGWHVWRAVPQAELVEPLAAGRSQALQLAAVVAGVLTALMVAFLGWQLRPLRQLEERAQRLLVGGAAAAAQPEDDWPEAEGEIGRLARTLRHVWAERAQAESFNAGVLAKLRSVMAASPVGLAFTRDGRFELVSEEFCRQIGRAEHELVGQPTQLVFASNEDHLALRPQVLAAFERGEPYVGEWQLLRADGQVYWAQLRARAVDPEDVDAGAIWSASDISDQVQARRHLERAALHDALTGVANRKGFEDAAARVLAAPATQRPASVVMIDLDHFKPINDSAGHAAGDAVLVAVAQAIGAAVRTSDVVGRLGGDEFAVLLPRCGLAQAVVVAEKVRKAIQAIALPWQGRVLGVGASLGVAELGDSHAGVAQWLADADAACYAAKRGGRDAVREATLRLVKSGG
jgi:diguanylate cyclase (GGDEF)-like protein/PAS domain S-box-containing protein